MSFIGGSIEAVTLKGRSFPVAADSDVNRKLGGFNNEIQSNGDGSGRLIKTREPMSVEGLQLSIDDDNGDQEFLQELANMTDFFPVTMTLASGAIWQGTGQITGDLQYSTNNASASVNLGGTGELTKQ